jgi:DNA-binding transcriptional MerR regulator
VSYFIEVFMEDKLLTTGEAAAKLGVSLRTVQRWDAGDILKPDIRLPSAGCTGGRRYYLKNIEKFRDEVLRRGR